MRTLKYPSEKCDVRLMSLGIIKCPKGFGESKPKQNLKHLNVGIAMRKCYAHLMLFELSEFHMVSAIEAPKTFKNTRISGFQKIENSL